MKIEIDTDTRLISLDDHNEKRQIDLYSPEGFSTISDIWTKVGWDQKHCYTFSWLGRPIIQLPDDMIRIQEAIYEVKPDIIIETGVAHGGSLIFYASICHAIGKGRIIGIDIEIRPHNRSAIEAHELFPYIELIEQSSTAPEVAEHVRKGVKSDETVLVILDSDHSYRHVASELETYAPFVTKGSYIVATDGIMKDLTDVPRGKAEWDKDNPTQAALDFAANNDDFVISPPSWPFNESPLVSGPSHWPSAWLKKVL